MSPATPRASWTRCWVHAEPRGTTYYSGVVLPRRVRLALCRPDGSPLGVTPELALGDDTWWSDAAGLVSAAREAWGLDVTILRLAATHRADGFDHQVYVAETDADPVVPLTPTDPALGVDESLRMPWAAPSGPRAQLAWASSALRAAGMQIVEPPHQLRSWNLSSLWRLPTDAGTVWLKAVPPFFAHEGAVIEALARHPVPRVIARTDGIALLADIPGEDLYAPSDGDARRMIDVLIGIQSALSRADLPADMPSWSVIDLADAGEHTLRETPALASRDRAKVSGLLERLPQTASALEACGLTETLVHGDFHPGNFRGTAESITLLDWGDSGWGHPLLDAAAFTERMDASSVDGGVVLDGCLAVGGARQRSRACARAPRARQRPASGSHLPGFPGSHRTRRAGVSPARPLDLVAQGGCPRHVAQGVGHVNGRR